MPEKDADMWKWIVGLATPPALLVMAWFGKMRSTVTRHSGDIDTLIQLTKDQTKTLAGHIEEDRETHERIVKLETHVDYIRQDTSQILSMLNQSKGQP